MPAHAHQDRNTVRADADAIDRRLAEELAFDPGGTPDPSNWEASLERAFAERQFSRPCPACKGSGARELTAKRLKAHARQVARATPGDLARVRQEHHLESMCRVCEGIGYRPPPERRGNLQRTWCEDCEGSGRDAKGETCRRCRGLQSVCLGAGDSMFNTVSCPRCRGWGDVYDEDVQDVCQLCRGEGCTVPITRRPTGASPDAGFDLVTEAGRIGHTASGKAYNPDTEATTDPGDDLPARPRARDEGLVEAFERLQRECPTLARTLALYRGAVGNRWDHGHPWGRVFVVWPETEAAKLLMAEAPDHLRRRFGARPLELLAALRDVEDQAKVPDVRRRGLIARADRQARQLVDAAKLALAEAARA